MKEGCFFPNLAHREDILHSIFGRICVDFPGERAMVSTLGMIS